MPNDVTSPAIVEARERTTQIPPPPEPGNARRRRLRWALYAVPILGLIVGFIAYTQGGAVMTTDDAYVETDKVGLSTDVSGMVKSVEVQDNQHVRAGQVLFRLDPEPFRLKLDEANTQLGIVADSLNALKANYQGIQAQIAQAQDQITFAQRQFDRSQTLATGGYTPQSTLDQDRVTLQSARQQLQSLQAQLAGVVANLDGNPNIAIDQHPRYRQALAERDEAVRELRDAVVTSPFNGIVTNVPSLEPGMYLQASTTAFYLVRSDLVWVEAEPKETELTYVRPGQPVTVTVDTYPGRTWHGTVNSLGPAAQSEFSLLPAQNTSGNWVKVVQRIPLRVTINTSGPNMPPLSAGMSAEVSVDTGHKRGWPHFLTALLGHRQKPA